MLRGVPNTLMHQDRRTSNIPLSLLPSPSEAVGMYRENVRSLTDPAPFGEDLLDNSTEKKHIRESYFKGKYPSYEHIFHQLVNRVDTPFRNALLLYCDITTRLSRSS